MQKKLLTINTTTTSIAYKINVQLCRKCQEACYTKKKKFVWKKFEHKKYIKKNSK